MKTKTGIALLLVILFCSGAWAKTKTLDSQWLQAPVKIDGAPDEWAAVARAKNNDLSIDYAFQNDGENLYVIFAFNDPRYVSNLNRTGMTIWINPEGKNKKKQGVRFFYKMVPAELLIAMMEMQQGKPVPEEEKAKIRQVKMHEVKQCYLVNGKEVPIPLTHPLNPQFEGRRASYMLVFEYKIPFRYLESVNPPGAQPVLETGKQVAVGFEWGGMTDKMRGDMLRGNTVRTEGRQRADSTADLTRERSERDPGGLTGDDNFLQSPARGPKKYDFWVNLNLARQ